MSHGQARTPRRNSGSHRIGQGTWRMGEMPTNAKPKSAPCVKALDLGMTLIDTAEMYAEDGADR